MSTTSRAVRSSLTAMLLLSAVSCDGSATPEPPPTTAPAGPTRAIASPTPVCSGPRVSFGPVAKTDVLTDVATAVTITSPSGGPLDAPLRPVRRYTAEVLALGDVPDRFVYDAFARKIGADTPLPSLGAVVENGSGTMSVQGPGRIVTYEGATAVKATFDFACGGGGAPIRGVVSSWFVTTSGVTECRRKGRTDVGPMEAEALALGCGSQPAE